MLLTRVGSMAVWREIRCRVTSTLRHGDTGTITTHLIWSTRVHFLPLFLGIRIQLTRAAFNFSHMITELSFGPHYPTLLNPLDKTIATTEDHYYKYQYFLSIVPTIYSKGNLALDTYANAPPSNRRGKNLVFTNQYAVTSQSSVIPESPYFIPGLFFKYNIEPILLLISEERTSFLSLLVRLVNTVSGVMVTGGWLYQMSGWLGELLGRRRRRGKSEGVLTGRHEADN